VAALGALALTAPAGAADPPASACLRAATQLEAPAEPALAAQVDDARRRLEAEPRQAERAGRLGMIFHAYELLDPARECYAEAIKLDPQPSRWRYYHAIVLTALGRTDEAGAEIDLVLATEPAHVAAIALRAELRAASGAMRESEADWRRTVELAPESSVAHSGLGRVLAAQGRHLEAIPAFRHAVAIDSNPQARYGLALAYRRVGRQEEASRILAAYRDLDRTTPSAVPDPWMDEVRALNRSVRNQVALGAELARA
jgi:tetratricopeptide (TPR) repeat protein